MMNPRGGSGHPGPEVYSVLRGAMRTKEQRPQWDPSERLHPVQLEPRSGGIMRFLEAGYPPET